MIHVESVHCLQEGTNTGPPIERELGRGRLLWMGITGRTVRVTQPGQTGSHLKG